MALLGPLLVCLLVVINYSAYILLERFMGVVAAGWFVTRNREPFTGLRISFT
jgi:hypothetical protein